MRVLLGMKTKTASKDTRTPAQIEAAEIERDRSELHRKLDAIGAANKWLRTSLSKVSGRHVGEQDVALLVRPVLNDIRGAGYLWAAVLYAADGSERSEWFGHDWYTALTSAVWALVDDDVLDLVQRQGRGNWFKFENIHGEEIFP
jgi:hypothetical protein